MSFFPPVELIRKKNKLVKVNNDYSFEFNVLKSGKEKASIKSISICNTYIALAYNNTIIFNNLKGEQLDKKYQSRDNVSKLKFRDEKMLGVGMENGEIELIGMFCYDRIKTFKGHKSSINDLIFSNNFQSLYTCSRDFTIKIWNIWQGICEHTIDYHMDNITSLLLYNNNDTDYLISSSYDGFIFFYDISKKKHTNKLEIQEPIEYIYVFEKEYLILSVRNVIKFYSITDFKYIKDIVISTKTIFYINSFKKYIVASSLDMSIYFIDPFYKNTEEIKIVCIVNYSNHPKSFEVYNDIIALGEIDGTWSIELYHKKEKLSKNKKKDKTNKKCYEDEKFVYNDKNVNLMVKKFKYNDALMYIIKNDPQSTLSLLDYFSKHKVLTAACRTYCVDRAINILIFLRKKFVVHVLMFELFFSFFSANKWILTTKDKRILDELQLLKKGFLNVKKYMKYFNDLKDIADCLRN
ncbi:conserved Plasmodium protein, unknown function [Plasmodium gaboni]|uniref:U3 small nucleolar RNA-associated protein 15 n=1 Tax=Plasmodium gaboni TaxID=647221 RepID=A0ABY1USI6_9APIC|nr:conserved Plasmodium protein, unknown function [Plasmodium gaboni]